MPWRLLERAVSRLKQLQASWDPLPGPWLFRSPARVIVPTPEDRVVVARLEAQSAAIDRLGPQAEAGREPPGLIERRRDFLYECRAAGLFDEDDAEARARWLRNWDAPALVRLLEAARTLRSWGVVEPDRALPDCVVTLDFVRLSFWPPGEDGQEWACAGLSLLTDPLLGDQGAVIRRSGDTILRAWWRRDGDRPALLGVSRGGKTR